MKAWVGKSVLGRTARAAGNITTDWFNRDPVSRAQFLLPRKRFFLVLAQGPVWKRENLNLEPTNPRNHTEPIYQINRLPQCNQEKKPSGDPPMKCLNLPSLTCSCCHSWCSMFVLVLLVLMFSIFNQFRFIVSFMFLLFDML